MKPAIFEDKSAKSHTKVLNESYAMLKFVFIAQQQKVN